MIAEVMIMREEEKKRSSQNSSFKRFFKKRWVYPAIYIASAAIILTGVLWYQNSNSATKQDDFNYNATDVPGKKFGEPSVEVNSLMENILLPVKDADSVVYKRSFYDNNAKVEDQEAALILHNNQYHQNTGVDIGMKDGESFEVIAALSGKVTNVADKDALLGNVIEIEHDKGIITKYQSVTEINVKVGDQVKQGQVIAKAGESQFDEEVGVHVHFEIRKNDLPLNPHEYFQKPLSALLEDGTSDHSSASDEKKTEENSSDEKSDDKSKDDKVTDEEKDANDKEKTDEETKEESKESSNI